MIDYDEDDFDDNISVNSSIISECCGEPIYGEICGEHPNEIGICSRCKEWSGVVTEEDDE